VNVDLSLCGCQIAPLNRESESGRIGVLIQFLESPILHTHLDKVLFMQRWSFANLNDVTMAVCALIPSLSNAVIADCTWANRRAAETSNAIGVLGHVVKRIFGISREGRMQQAFDAFFGLCVVDVSKEGGRLTLALHAPQNRDWLGTGRTGANGRCGWAILGLTIVLWLPLGKRDPLINRACTSGIDTWSSWSGHLQSNLNSS